MGFDKIYKSKIFSFLKIGFDRLYPHLFGVFGANQSRKNVLTTLQINFKIPELVKSHDVSYEQRPPYSSKIEKEKFRL